MKNKKKTYYLGLDIGTNSVGYAAAGKDYNLLKFHGEPVWGVTTFEAAALAAERRANRTARRRLDRRQQRVQLISEIFASEIAKVDPNFFIRRKESALFSDETQYGVKLFDGGISDDDYHREYPTIHHLIYDLMTSSEEHDVRLVYIACAWLVAHRGHFLLDASVENIRDFKESYDAFVNYLEDDCETFLPWKNTVSYSVIQEIMQKDIGVKGKKSLFIEEVLGGKKPVKSSTDDFIFSADALITLLCGGSAAPKDIFQKKEEYAELKSLSLGADEDTFDAALKDLGDDGQLLHVMRRMYDCALLNITLCGKSCISEAKIEIYNRHAEDLKWLKSFIIKYCPTKYNEIFRLDGKENYAAYSYNTKSVKNSSNVKKVKKENFSSFLSKIVKNIEVADADKERYDDMMNRLALNTFLPKQKDGDNRVIPQQLYHYELNEILSHAQEYLPFLTVKDAEGISNLEKIISVFEFRIPYYVGPLNRASSHAWIERKSGKIYPWNFKNMVDLDKSEENFIARMTNTCTYLPGEDVLPYCSLLYSRFMVLNELNNLKINQDSISVEAKQDIFNKLFVDSKKKLTLKGIETYLKARGDMQPGDELSGIDATVKASLKSYQSFKRMLDNGTLSEDDVETIIKHAAYSEDKRRMEHWLEREYPSLSPDDRKYILRLKLKEFGRLSRRLLTEITGANKETGETFTIIEALWETNDNLMQLLSERYTFRDEIEAFTVEHYSKPENQKTLAERLDDMYISNAVKRPIIRAIDIVSEVVKAMDGTPEKIFIEMARGGTPDQKGTRTLSRCVQLQALYKQIKTDDARRLARELEDMGDSADNRLQSDRLYLYYMQMGRCMYTGQPIDLTQLSTKLYDIDHIYPQSKVKDDSILNNKVLVLSSANGLKGDRYPIDPEIRSAMHGMWEYLKSNKLITEEKFRRLTRQTGFNDDELHQFINRQLVETRQSTKAAAQILKDRYPETEIVYVKAGMVSEFRQEFDMLKCRSVNDLHHAKDAYLNIVVGNVYHEIFTKRWFDTSQEYNISVKKIFNRQQKPYGNLVWSGAEDLAKVRKTMAKNAIHITQYQFCRHRGQNGGFFDQNPLKARKNLIPLKKGMDPAKYGGYNGSTSTFFVLAGYTSRKKKEIMFFPVELMYSERFVEDDNFAAEYIQTTLEANGKKASDVFFPLGMRILKVNTLLSLDGFLVCLSSGSIKDGRVGFLPLTQFICGYDTERYIKRIERIAEKKESIKKKSMPNYIISPKFDGVSKEENLKLYDLYSDKLENSIFSKRPGVSVRALKEQRAVFAGLDLDAQCRALSKINLIFSRQPNGIDLSDIGLSSSAFKARRSMYLSGWKKEFSDLRIVDMSAAGLFVSRSENLLDLL